VTPCGRNTLPEACHSYLPVIAMSAWSKVSDVPRAPHSSPPRRSPRGRPRRNEPDQTDTRQGTFVGRGAFWLREIVRTRIGFIRPGVPRCRISGDAKEATVVGRWYHRRWSHGTRRSSRAPPPSAPASSFLSPKNRDHIRPIQTCESYAEPPTSFLTSSPHDNVLLAQGGGGAGGGGASGGGAGGGGALGGGSAEAMFLSRTNDLIRNIRVKNMTKLGGKCIAALEAGAYTRSLFSST